MSTTDFNSAGSGRACPRCGAMSAVGAQFCGSCGGNLVGAPPPPPPTHQFQQQLFAAGSGINEQVMATMPPDAAFDSAVRQLTALGAQITWQQRPVGLRFRLTKFSWYACFKVKYEGTVNIAAYGPGQSQVTTTVKALHGEMTMEYLAVAALIVILTVYNMYTMGVLAFALAIICAVGCGFIVTSKLPRDLARQIVQSIATGPVMATPTAAAPFQTPLPQTVQAASPPPPPPPPKAPPVPEQNVPTPPPREAATDNSQNDAVVKLKQLAQLREQNLITQEEFDAKKREILNKMLQ